MSRFNGLAEDGGFQKLILRVSWAVEVVVGPMKDGAGTEKETLVSWEKGNRDVKSMIVLLLSYFGQ